MGDDFDPIEWQANDLFDALWGEDYHSRADTDRTPVRFIQMMKELTTPEPFDFTVFDAPNIDEMIVVKDIAFHSLCAHHILPFIGMAHVAYVPNGKLAGISKLARTVAYCSRSLQVQEELTQQIVQMLIDNLQPLGVAVMLEAEHTCMTLRGVKAPGSTTVTSSMSGCFADHTKLARQEFLDIVHRRP